MKKIRCPDCKESFEIEMEEFDEGDMVNCPECNLELVVEVSNGRPRLRVAKEKDIDEDEEISFDELYEE